MDREQIRKELIEHRKTCPLCKGPTTKCRLYNNNRECIACKNKEGYGYSFKPRKVTEEEINRIIKQYNLINNLGQVKT